MGLDTDFAVILREIIQFLECLREVKLSSALETVRENLLTRSKTTLSIFALSNESSSAAEPYLHMNASSKGLLPLQLLETNELDTQEYVIAEETVQTNDQKCQTSQTHLDHYETLISIENEKKKELERGQENSLVKIYLGLSGAQAKSKSLKCGPLHRKEGKKLFFFEQYRVSWVALVGSHLLIYGNERDSKPHIVQGIRGYSGRPAPNIVTNDQQRSEAAFEIFKPGNKTLQFIARTSKDMKQWVAKICQVGSGYETNIPDGGFESKEDLSSIETTGETEEIVPINPEQVRKTLVADVTSPPALPARIPIRLSRGLPSLPTNDRTPSYEIIEDEEDGTYHRIEDFRNKMSYQNVMVKNQCEKSIKSIAYDDVHAILKKEPKNVSSISKEENTLNRVTNENISSLEEETYDDIANTNSFMGEKKNREVVQNEDINETCELRSPSVVSYDDIEVVANTPMFGSKVRVKEEDTQKKSPCKKSFLNKMRIKKESLQKKEKIIAARSEALTPPQVVQTKDIVTYDDVSDLVTNKGASVPEDTSTYTSPPIPRPVFKSPNPILPINKALYDDINGFSQRKEVEQQMQCLTDDNEHYKSPRSDAWQQIVLSQGKEQLYDDVAILTNFTARQRELSDEIKDQDIPKSSFSPDKKSWNRFVTNRKSKSNDSICSGSSKRTSSEISDPDNLDEQPTFSRKNTFQKLINKMENSLGKGSPRTLPPIPMSKSCGLNTSS